MPLIKNACVYKVWKNRMEEEWKWCLLKTAMDDPSGLPYGDDLCPSQLQSLAEDLQLAGVEGQMDGKLRSVGKGRTDGKDLPICIRMCGSAHECVCMVDGSGAMAAL